MGPHALDGFARRAGIAHMTTTLLLALLLPLVAAVCWCAWVALKGLAHVVAALFVGRK